MGRIAKGWSLRRRAEGGVWYVRFSLHGRIVERSTGCRDRREAAQAASRIYAALVTTEPTVKPRGAGGPIEELVARWLLSLESTHSADTRETWELYSTTHWTRFVSVSDLTRDNFEAYRNERLKVVQAETVRKELSALRVFVTWLGLEVEVPGVPKRATGTRYATRRRVAAPEFSPEQAQAIIDALPEWSSSPRVERFPIRARFIVAYETSLRPSTLDRLEAPKHYRSGSSTLLITPDIDKARFGRELPLTPRAREALDSICPKEGLIFGKHDYRDALKDAVEEALPPEIADRFAGAHFRSARITHWLEQTGNLPGVQYMAGHVLNSTTARYVKPSLRAALDTIRTAPAPKKKRRTRRK